MEGRASEGGVSTPTPSTTGSTGEAPASHE
jgi:hypothetical protein